MNLFLRRKKTRPCHFGHDETRDFSLNYFSAKLPIPRGIQRKASCSCGGGCPKCQAKDLHVSQPNDVHELEADRVAEQVMQTSAALNFSGSSSKIQRKKQGNRSSKTDSVQTNSGGQILSKDVLNFFEPRFERELGNVRVHADSDAAKSAKNLDAAAFTVGQDIYFGEGQYQPNTSEGKKLLAHELAHTVQQKSGLSPKIQRKPTEKKDKIHDSILDEFCRATGILREEASQHSQEYQAWLAENYGDVDIRGCLVDFDGSIICKGKKIDPNRIKSPTKTSSTQPTTTPTSLPHQHGKPGTTTIEENPIVNFGIVNPFEPDADKDQKVWDGEVRRNELAEDKTVIHSTKVKIKYDESKCEVTLPYKIAFQHPTGNPWTPCATKDTAHPPKPFADDKFKKISDSFLASVDKNLNDWYSIGLEGCEKHPCKSGGIKIKTDVTPVKDGESPDIIVILANTNGRACAEVRDGATTPKITLFETESEGTMAHEAGHIVLGMDDEYPPDKPGQHPERERMDDFSMMAAHSSFGRKAVFHERHFAFVPAFLNSYKSILGGCTAKLTEVSRPTVFNFRTPASVLSSGGYANFGGANSAYAELSFDLGIPLTRARDWELFLGTHGTMILQLEGDSRTAFLVGARVGLEKYWNPSGGGFNLGGFAGGGAAFVSDKAAFGGATQFLPGAFGEFGIRGGYNFSSQFNLQGEAGLGTTTQFDLHNADFEQNSQTLQWFRAGLKATWTF